MLADVVGEAKYKQGAGAAVGSEMAERKAWVVIAGRKPVAKVSTAAGAVRTVREGTTGRVVATLPRVWAVAAEPALQPRVSEAAPGAPAVVSGQGVPAAELGFYRKYTEALLRRYMQMSMEAGRVPSMMGREVLCGKASSYKIHGFDDAVNFRIDVERCLRRLEPAERDVVRRVAMQEYTQGEAAALLGISLRTCVQRYGRALDRLTGILLEARLLEPFKALSSGRGQGIGAK